MPPEHRIASLPRYNPQSLFLLEAATRAFGPVCDQTL